MSRPVLALVLLVVFTAVGFGWRTVVQLRRHGDTGWRFTRTGPDRFVAPALALAFALLGLGPALGAAGQEADRGGGAAAAAGAALAVVAGVLTVVAQLQMGASWRIGSEPGERTDLVTSGLFGHVRNPIFTGMIAFAVGLALLAPHPATVLGAVLAVVAVEAQVRLVEEPNLVAVHGDAYRRWASRTGRFLPAVGRLPAPASAPARRHAGS